MPRAGALPSKYMNTSVITVMNLISNPRQVYRVWEHGQPQLVVDS